MNRGYSDPYFVCRTSPPAELSDLPLISYRSPMGAMALRTVGSTFVRPDGKEIQLRERALLRPVKLDVWDAVDTIFESEDSDMITVRSLRELLAPKVTRPADDVLATLLAEEEAAANVIAGRRRSVIAKMGLRDQPVSN